MGGGRAGAAYPAGQCRSPAREGGACGVADCGGTTPRACLMDAEGREQRFIFGEVAELYDRARAGYSATLVDDVLSFVGVDSDRLRALEVGAGTGKATVAFAVRGLEILALEPSLEMATVARRRVGRGEGKGPGGVARPRPRYPRSGAKPGDGDGAPPQLPGVSPRAHRV